MILSKSEVNLPFEVLKAWPEETRRAKTTIVVIMLLVQVIIIK